jgi:hypothetical protein
MRNKVAPPFDGRRDPISQKVRVSWLQRLRPRGEKTDERHGPSQAEKLKRGFHEHLHRQDVSNVRFEGFGYLGFDAGLSDGISEI